MKLVILPYSQKSIDPIKEEHILLIQGNWDDYGVKTSYSISAYNKTKEQYEKLGNAKIISSDPEDYDDGGYLTLSGEYHKLPDNFGFLGQTENFYARVLEVFDEKSKGVLENLNDLSLFYGLRDKFVTSDYFKGSLIRFSDAERALKAGQFIINKQSYTDSFSFEFSNGDDGNRTTCAFDFDSLLPVRSRVNVIIGENGTGKTTYLADLALSMSGRENKGEFLNSRPPFSKVIAVSFSSFDTFEIPKGKISFSYKYCGLRDKDGFMSRNRILDTYKVSCDKILKKNLVINWEQILSHFIKEDKLNNIKKDFFENKIYSNIMSNSFLSSGESIILYSFTQIIAEANKESLILFDEPELHLHPQAISNLIPSINELLHALDAYAIIATHSPIILQQIPSKYVRVFDNTSGRVRSRVLELETLGENLNSITLEVFKTIKEKQEYRKILRSLHGKYSIEQINSIFNEKLSINSQLYLQSLAKNEK